MELFRYRNLALGSCTFLVSLFLSFYINATIRIVIIASTVIAILLFILIHAIKKSPHSLNALCHYVPSLIFIILAMVLSIIFFDKTELEKLCDGEEQEVTGVVTEVIYQTNYLGYYELEIETINGVEFNDKVKLSINGNPLARGSVIKAKGVFRTLEKSELGFDEAGYLLGRGIVFGFDVSNFEVIGYEKMSIKDFFEDVNQALTERFNKIDDISTFTMLSALFLGNKALLDDSVQRDFRRIGLSHVLALSGMHITIIVTLLGYSLHFLPIRRIYKELLLILATLIFIGITGFSDSAMRAGFMVCLTYTLYFFGNRISLTSALFYSVSFLYICNPFNIFSVSLTLSFFAMLGCIFSSKIIHRAWLFKKIKIKLIRFILFTLISSISACMFTLPIISIQFGTLAILSPIANIIIAPLLSLLIYIAPIFLIIADIPYVSLGLGWTCTKITELSTYLGKAFSSIDNIVIPIKSTLQLIGVLVLAISILLFVICKRNRLKYMVAGMTCGILVFISGTIAFYLIRGENTYVGGFSTGKDDVVFLESQGELTLFDVTNTASGDYALFTSISSKLGYYEIDNYIITDYSSKTDTCFNKLSSNTIVKNVYLPKPVDVDEENMLNNIELIAQLKQIEVHIIEDSIYTNNSVITFAKEQFLPRSEKRAVAFSVECGGALFTYLGSGTYELLDYFVSDSAYLSDVIIFGAYGPNNQIEYAYDTPHLDYCVFFGESDTYANEDFYEKIKDKISTSPRFLLTP